MDLSFGRLNGPVAIGVHVSTQSDYKGNRIALTARLFPDHLHRLFCQFGCHVSLEIGFDRCSSELDFRQVHRCDRHVQPGCREIALTCSFPNRFANSSVNRMLADLAAA